MYAQQWDWIRSPDNRFAGLNWTWSDSLGNIYNCLAYPDNVQVQHSKKYADTLNNLPDRYRSGNLIKSNKRGKLLWQAIFWGRPIEMSFFNDNIYLLCRFTRSEFIAFTFGSKTLDLTSNDGSREYYFLFKYDKSGNQIKSSPFFNTPSSYTATIGNLIVKDENNIFFGISCVTDKKNDSINFKNKNIYISNDKIKYPFLGYLISTKLDGSLNWSSGLSSSVNLNTLSINNDILTKLSIDYTPNPQLYSDDIITQYDLQGNLINVKRIDRNFDRFDPFQSLILGKDGNYYLFGRVDDTVKIGNKIIPITKLKPINGQYYSYPIIIKMDQNFNYVLHWTFPNFKTSIGTGVIDKLGNIFTSLGFRDTVIINGISYFNSNNLLPSRVLFKISNSGKIETTIVLPSDISLNGLFFHLWLDKKDNLYCDGVVSNIYNDLLVNIDSFYLKLGNYGYTSFQAKYNNQKLQLKNKILYCKNDSLHVVADTAYKKFKWIIDKIVYWGTAIKPQLSSYGKYYVSLYGYEDDSVTSLHNDSIMYYQAPKAGLMVDKQKICRYSSIKFTDNSLIEQSLGSSIKGFLRFGDGKDTVVTKSNKSMLIPHQYTDTGLFNVQYIMQHKNCLDTIDLLKLIQVINSPKSDFSILKDKSCTPVLLKLKSNYTGYYDSMIWFLDGKQITSSKISDFQSKINQSGTHIISHQIFGYGCSNSTKQTLKLFEGFTTTDSLICNYATITNNTSILLSWNKHPAAVKYNIYCGSEFKTTRDTFIIINNYNINRQSYNFIVKGIDTCDNMIKSNVANTIYLNGIAEDFNKNSTLNWTPYLYWYKGIKNYQLQCINSRTETWENVTIISSSINNFIDHHFIEGHLFSAGKCYRIIASENNSNYNSTSNEFCLEYNPFIFAPNSFTPNNDGINDTYQWSIPGARSFKIAIFSRWGNKVFESNNIIQNWDGKYMGEICSDGVYLGKIEIVSETGKIYYLNTTITLIR